MSCVLNSVSEVVVLSASGKEFHSLGAMAENDLSPIEDKENLGTARRLQPEDRSDRDCKEKSFGQT